MPTIWELLNMPAPTAEPSNITKKSIKTNKSALNAAKERKDDEFYTRLADVEFECSHFVDQFKDKIIYMPCDNPKMSEFWHYFHSNFTNIGLRKIICSFYDGTDTTYSIEYFGGNDADLTCGKIMPMGTGDFRNASNAKYFDEADIVVTNPPFSLFREFIAILQKHHNDFLIIGNMNAVTYKEFFPLLRDNKVRLGYMHYGHTMYFRLGKKGDKASAEVRKQIIAARASDRALFIPTEATCARAKGIKATFRPDEYDYPFAAVTAYWYTTLNVATTPSYDLDKMPHYDPKLYPKYDNYDAIEVSKLKDIPGDYFECMGVPVTYVEKHNPNMFILLSCTYRHANPEGHTDGTSYSPYVNGHLVYNRLFIRRIDQPVDPKQA